MTYAIGTAIGYATNPAQRLVWSEHAPAGLGPIVTVNADVVNSLSKYSMTPPFQPADNGNYVKLEMPAFFLAMRVGSMINKEGDPCQNVLEA